MYRTLAESHPMCFPLSKWVISVFKSGSFTAQSHVTPCVVMQPPQHSLCCIPRGNFGMLRPLWGKGTFVPRVSPNSPMGQLGLSQFYRWETNGPFTGGLAAGGAHIAPAVTAFPGAYYLFLLCHNHNPFPWKRAICCLSPWPLFVKWPGRKDASCGKVSNPRIFSTRPL